MAISSSIRIVNAVTYDVNDLNGASQQIPVPATTLGNYLLVAVAINQTTAASASSVTDSGSNTYAQLGTTQTSGTGAGHVSTQLFGVANAASSTWVKVTTGATSKMVAVTFIEFAGVLTASATDSTNGGTATAATSVTASNTPGTTGDVIVMLGATGGASLAHVPDGTASAAFMGVPYTTGTVGAGVCANVVTFIGAPTTTMVSSWTAASSANFAWSSVSLKATTPGTGPLYNVFSGYNISAADINQIINTLTGQRSDAPILVANRIQAGLAGATAQCGFVGGTASGAPTSGSFLVGDWVIDRTGFIYVCTTAGSPGVWARCGSGGYFARCAQSAVQNFTGGSSLQAVTNMSVASGVGGYDPKSMFNSGNNGFTIPFSGSRWRVIAGQHVNTGANTGRFYVSITVNGTERSRGFDGPLSQGFAGGVVTDILSLNSGDIVRAAILCGGTGNTIADSNGAANFLCVALADA